MGNFLFIGTHPDDVELGVGATVNLLVKRGHSVTMLDLTDGEPTPFGDKKTRKKEAEKAAKILAVKERLCLGLPNRELVDSIDARHKLAAIYKKVRPDIIIAQDKRDYHPDHIAAYDITAKARFDAKLTKTDIEGEPFWPPKMLRFFASHLPHIFNPSFIVDVTETFDTKLETISAYQSQFKAAEREEMIKEKIVAIARFYGSLINVKYAEPFISEEPIKLNDLDLLIG